MQPALCRLTAFPLLVAAALMFGSAPVAGEPAPSAQQCQTQYSKILIDFNACVGALFIPDTSGRSRDRYDFYNEQWTEAYAEKLEKVQEWLETQKQNCLKSGKDPDVCEQEYQTAFNNEKTQLEFDLWLLQKQWLDAAYFEITNQLVIYNVGFKDCVAAAVNASKTLLGSCGSSFGSSGPNRALYCTSAKAAMVACTANCVKEFDYGPDYKLKGACANCDQISIESFNACAPPTAHLRIRGELGPCPEAYQAVQSAFNNCTKLPVSDRAQCRKDASDLQAAMMQACYIARGSTPNAPNSDAGANGRTQIRNSRTTGVNNLPGPKKLPPSPCRNGQRCGTSSSAGLAPSSGKPKINLDQHDFAPSFVNTSPNSGRIGNRQGGGGGAAGGSAAKSFGVPINASPMDRAPR